MKKLWRKIFQLILVLIVFTGCTTMGTNNASEPSGGNRTDADRTVQEGAILGTVGGAGLGAIVGALADDSRGAKDGAIVGGIAGIVVGTLFGKSIADQKQDVVCTEERLNNEIKKVAQANEQLRNYNAQTEIRIATLKEEISKLKCQYAARKVKYSQLQKKQNTILASLEKDKQDKLRLESELNSVRSYLEGVNKAQSKTDADKLQKEIDELKINIAMLDTNNMQMAKLADSLTVRKSVVSG